MQDTTNSSGVQNIDIDREMREAYLQYSMSVIVGRALPDVRDGLKPVHRRILFAQNEMNNRSDRPYLKSARVVGDVIGKYHPHGDTAVYDTLVRMAQDFSLRYPLEDGQGNFGSIDGDSPAAMRYTEIRMTKLAEELLQDIEKETVNFSPNYDGSLQIPQVLPARVPNLLINGSSGIAVGMATNIPPHNLSEVVQACIELLKNPDLSTEEIIKIIPGPDFPTAGVIIANEGLLQAYHRGKGSIIVKGVAVIETYKDGREDIIINQIPYQVNKAKLIESIAELVKNKQIEGISDLRDESSREGMRIVVQLKRGENASVILNRLYKFTQLQVSFGITLLALDSKNQPVVFGLKQLLEAFIEHRKEVVIRRTIFDLRKAKEKAHILEGLKKALEQIDQVITTIKASPDGKTAQANLVSHFSFSVAQAQAILEMRLQRLTGLERDKIEQELQELEALIQKLNQILANPAELVKTLIEELHEIQQKYGDERRTKIESTGVDILDEDLIADETFAVMITHSGYIKRMSLDEYRLQKRGGKGTRGIETRDEDFVNNIFIANAKTNLLVFTDKGRLYWTKVYRLPLGSKNSKGKAIANVVQLQANEKVRAVLPVEKFTADKFVVMLTKQGVIKKTPLEAFSNPRQNGIIALTTDLEDHLIEAKISDGSSDIFIATKEGMSIRFEEGEVRPMGRAARGVSAIKLNKSDEVVSLDVIEQRSQDTILLVTSGGYGKRSYLEEYRIQGRAGVGLITQKTTDKVGFVVGAKKVKDHQEVILTTTLGQVIRTKVRDISIMGRNTQGVKLMSVDREQELITSFALLDEQDEDSASAHPKHH